MVRRQAISELISHQPKENLMDASWVIPLFINFILSFVVARIAENKGRSFAGFFWLSFLLSFLIGLLVVLASSPVTKEEKEITDPRLLVKCPKCAEQILAEASVCKHCGRDVEPRNDIVAAVAAEDFQRAQAYEAYTNKIERRESIVKSIVLFVFSAFALAFSIPIFSSVTTTVGPFIIGLILIGVALGMLAYGIRKLKRMPKKFLSD